MSDRILSAEEKAAQERRGAAGAAHRSGPPHMRMGQPGEKSQNFGPSARRLLGLLGREGRLVWVGVRTLMTPPAEFLPQPGVLSAGSTGPGLARGADK